MDSSIQRIACQLLEELEDGYLEVVKVCKGEGSWMRVPVSRNAPWYQKFCANYCNRSKRYPKPRTIIKRQHTIRALNDIIKGKRQGRYVERLMEVIRAQA